MLLLIVAHRECGSGRYGCGWKCDHEVESGGMLVMGHKVAACGHMSSVLACPVLMRRIEPATPAESADVALIDSGAPAVETGGKKVYDACMDACLLLGRIALWNTYPRDLESLRYHSGHISRSHAYRPHREVEWAHSAWQIGWSVGAAGPVR